MERTTFTLPDRPTSFSTPRSERRSCNCTGRPTCICSGEGAVRNPRLTHLTGQVSLFRPCGEGDNWPCGTEPICHPGGVFDELFQTGRSNGRSRRCCAG